MRGAFSTAVPFSREDFSQRTDSRRQEGEVLAVFALDGLLGWDGADCKKRRLRFLQVERGTSPGARLKPTICGRLVLTKTACGKLAWFDRTSLLRLYSSRCSLYKVGTFGRTLPYL